MTVNLYDYISKSQNLMISELSENDMNDLLYLIANTPIEYKNILNMPQNIKFGFEIEFENADFENVYNDMKKTIATEFINTDDFKEYNLWSIEEEIDITKYSDSKNLTGGEINSPISINTKEFWQELKHVCNILKQNNTKFDGLAGFHIHLNKDILNSKLCKWLKLLKTWIIFETDFIKIFNGEQYQQRLNAKYYAKNISYELYLYFFANKIDDYKTIKQINNKLKIFDLNRNHNLVFYTPKVYNKTFELRACNGTDNEILMQQFLNIFISMFKMINNNDSDNFIAELFEYYEDEKLFIYPETLYKLFDYMFDTIEDKAAAIRLYYKDTRYSSLTK